MSREIKFRQPLRNPDGAFKEWFYWGFIDGTFISPAMQLNAIDTRKESQQFTGLKDGKGNDVYEGDIITIRGKYNYYVKFEDGKFACYHTIEEYGRWGDLCRMSEMDWKQYEHEVIGNVYQTPSQA